MNPPNAPIGSTLVREDPSFADLVEEFVGSLGERLAALNAALSGEDYASLRTLAHQLKGSAGGYGYPPLTHAATRLEQAARGQELDCAQGSLDELTALVARVVVSAP